MNALEDERRALVAFLSSPEVVHPTRGKAAARLEKVTALLQGYTSDQNKPASASSQKSGQLK